MPNILDGAIIGAAIGVSEETITILKKTYDELVKNNQILKALYSVGNDNWEIYLTSLEKEV